MFYCHEDLSLEMGQNSSAPVSRRKSLRETWRSPFPRRSQTHQKTLSATFHFVDDNKHVEQLNINIASEEELMTLPGISRSIARSIVEYRQTIGGFKKVEDLALVSGIGAEKLDLIRPEICVRRKNISCTSSRAPSCDSLPSSEVGSGRCIGRIVNVNTANVFDLMMLHGMTQELAANVIHYRERRGPFHSIDELLKVKGINPLRFGALRSQLCVSDCTDEPVTKNGVLSNGKIPTHRKVTPTSKKSPSLANGFLAVDDIFELLSAKSPRPVIEDNFQYKRGRNPAARIASWNLQELSQEKVENPGVREVICRTLLENRFSILAVQEVHDDIALNKLCEELNSPSLRRVADWLGNSCQWKIALPTEQTGLGFLFDAGHGVQLSVVQTLQPLDSDCGLTALLATFQVDELQIALVNVHAKDCNAESIRKLEQAVKSQIKPCDSLLILGDFSGAIRSRELDELQTGLQYRPVVPVAMTTTNADSVFSNNISDNVFLNSEAQLQFTGMWGVVQQGLTHLAIPRGWMWGGAVSQHCPVWCEVFTHSLLAESTNADGCE